MPSRLRGFAPVRAWLAQQDAAVVDAARELVDDIAHHAPRLLLAHTHHKEIGACAFVRAAVHADRMIARVEDHPAPASLKDRSGVAALLRHLFTRWPTAPWLVQSMLMPGTSTSVHGGGDGAPPAWLAHAGQGGSLRDAGLPVDVTRALAHALSVSRESEPRTAIRMAQCVVAGVHGAARSGVAWVRALAQRPFGTREHERGIGRFLELIARCPVDSAAAPLVVDWLYATLRTDPGFSFAGRTASSLMARVRDEVSRGVINAKRYGALPVSGLDDACIDVAGVLWHVNELKLGADIASEAVRMHNCAAGFIDSVLRRECSLFRAVPFGADDPDGDADGAGVTIELRTRSRMIVQVKGFANRTPTPTELAVVRQWAAQNALMLRQ